MREWDRKHWLTTRLQELRKLRKAACNEVITAKIKHYVVLKTALSFLTGALTGLFLWITGVRLFFLFALLTFILNFIPNVGSIIATILPIPMVLVNPDFSILTLSLAIILPGTVLMVVGNVIEPKLLGDSLELHPITVLLSLIFWGIIWGIPGMLLAAPITAVFKILLENIEITKPVAILLEGKLPKSPKEAQEEQSPDPKKSMQREENPPEDQTSL